MWIPSILSTGIDFFSFNSLLDSLTNKINVEDCVKDIVSYKADNFHFERWKLIKQMNSRLLDKTRRASFIRRESFKHNLFFSQIERAFEKCLVKLEDKLNLPNTETLSEKTSSNETLSGEMLNLESLNEKTSSTETLNEKTSNLESSNDVRDTSFDHFDSSLDSDLRCFSDNLIDEYSESSSVTTKLDLEDDAPENINIYQIIESFPDQLTSEDQNKLSLLFLNQEAGKYEKVVKFADKLDGIFTDKEYLRNVLEFIEDLEANLSTYRITNIHSNKYRAISPRLYYGVVLRVFLEVFGRHCPYKKRNLDLRKIKKDTSMKGFLITISDILHLIDDFLIRANLLQLN